MLIVQLKCLKELTLAVYDITSKSFDQSTCDDQLHVFVTGKTFGFM
jgi:hypothetical protein